jgi:hypothetical protein
LAEFVDFLIDNARNKGSNGYISLMRFLTYVPGNGHSSVAVGLAEVFASRIAVRLAIPVPERIATAAAS